MVMEIIISVILLLVGIAILVTIHVCVVGRAFGGRDSVNGGNPIPIPIVRIPSMDAESIKELPCFNYEREGEVGIVDCAVCLESFGAGEKCRILPKCNHIFHAECIDMWLVKTGACPICRTGAIATTC
ncbi:hypothetical protein ABFS82_09G023800 [Erythranthe guttata]|uniref:RING-type domain-containing protein n=2 Tax=Erythranthe guttata TaxID=4155 RepID=A0A022RS30_ERYGU|nr:hypothetical protein MIMGU_mgv1a025712mg [Erythranthe guttata]